MPVKQTKENIQNIRLCILSLRAIPGRPCVDVFRLNSLIIEREFSDELIVKMFVREMSADFIKYSNSMVVQYLFRVNKTK